MRNKNTNACQFLLMHFNHGLINIIFNMPSKLHKIISKNISPDHLRPKKHNKSIFYLIKSQ